MTSTLPALASRAPAAFLVGSSSYRTGADDALKDVANLAFLSELPNDVQHTWLVRVRLLRIADRLAENERIEPRERRFYELLDGWRALRLLGAIDPQCLYADELAAIRRLWLTPAGPAAERARRAWDVYLCALADYHMPTVRIRSLADVDWMLHRRGGVLFQLFPYVTEELLDAAEDFGVLDTAWGDVRDLAEDSAAGLCYLPEDMLREHGVARAEVLTGRAVDAPGWQALMGWWLDHYLPALHDRAAGFINARGLHPSLVALRACCLRRYARIERVMREVLGDYRRFPERYWSEVRRELAEERSGERR